MDKLELLANLLQIENYRLLVNDFNNNDLMKYLRHQDELLNKIIEQNKELLQLLQGGDNRGRK